MARIPAQLVKQLRELTGAGDRLPESITRKSGQSGKCDRPIFRSIKIFWII
jgi:hypothetical protein